MPGQWIGLNEIEAQFKQFKFVSKRSQKSFLNLISDQCIQLLRSNTPQDTGDLARSWREVGRGFNFVDIGTDNMGLAEMLESGTPPHLILPKSGNVLRFEKGGQEIFAAQIFHPGFPANMFLTNVAGIIGRLIIKTLESALVETGHPYFANLRGVGGKGRKYQQVGRTSAGFKGGISSRGRSKLVRAGTGRRQLKRKLTLRRRTAPGKKRREMKTKLG